MGSPAACALRWWLPALRRIPHAFVAGHWPGARPLAAAESLPPLETPVASDADSVALVSFTSGTTGNPKGVLRTHSVLVATQRMLTDALELREGETHLSALLFVVLASLGAGATSVLADGDPTRPAHFDPARLAAQIHAHRVGVIVASPTIADRLAAHATATSAFDPCSASISAARRCSRRCSTAGGSPRLGARIIVLYGATEAEPIASLPADDYGSEERQATREGAGVLVGPPLQGVDLRIIADRHGTAVGPCTDAEFEALSLALGVEGEIVVAGTHVAPGYLGDTGNLLARIEQAPDAGTGPAMLAISTHAGVSG